MPRLRALLCLSLLAAACAAPPPLPFMMEEQDAGAPPLACGALVACGARCVSLKDDPTSCGACDRTCVFPNASAGCQGGECVIAACDEGFFDADRRPSNGCEAMNDCLEGAECRTSCDSTGRATCAAGMATCQPPAESCNGRDDNCDGRCDEGALGGCRLGVHRSVGGGGHFYTTDLNEAMSPPYTIEGANYFHIYRAQVTGTQPAYLCPKGNGKSFLTPSAVCEGLNVPGRLLGYWASDPRCGAQPLYRLYHDMAGDHFYTVSDAERQSAVDMAGYRFEGIVAYVWAAP